MNEAADGFRWGPEIAASPRWRSAVPATDAAGGEVQWRAAARSSIRSSASAWLENVGATIVSLAPGPRQPPRRLLRVAQRPRPRLPGSVGLQFRQGLAAFAGVGAVFPVGAPRLASPASEVGRSESGFLIREYGATWCDACRRLAPMIRAAEREGVRVEMIDVTDWSEDDLARRVPWAKALPIVEIFRADGAIVARLDGEEAMSFSNHPR